MYRPLPKLDPGLAGKALYFDCQAVSDPKTFELEDDATTHDNAKSRHKGKGKQKGEPLSEEEDSGTNLTKRERKEVRCYSMIPLSWLAYSWDCDQMKLKTAGPQWFDLPAPSDADRPRLARELEALRLRNALDPKRFYRKDAEGSKREMPKYFAVCPVLLCYSNAFVLTPKFS